MFGSGDSGGGAAGAASTLLFGSLSAASSFAGSIQKTGLEQGALDEQLRRAKAQQNQVRGDAAARAAASGVAFDSQSTQAYLSAMAEEFKRQLDWARNQGQQAIDAERTASTIKFATDFGGTLFKMLGS